MLGQIACLPLTFPTAPKLAGAGNALSRGTCRPGPSLDGSLGEIVARVSGTPFAHYVEERVLVPLGMSATAFDPFPGSLESLRAVGLYPQGASRTTRLRRNGSSSPVSLDRSSLLAVVRPYYEIRALKAGESPRRTAKSAPIDTPERLSPKHWAATCSRG